MLKLFLIPLLLTLAWTALLIYFRVPLEKGKKGYFWIIGVSGVLIAFLSLMLWVTHL